MKQKNLTSTIHNLYKTVFAPYKKVSLIDSWDLKKQDKQIKFLKQVVSTSDEIVPLK